MSVQSPPPSVKPPSFVLKAAALPLQRRFEINKRSEISPEYTRWMYVLVTTSHIFVVTSYTSTHTPAYSYPLIMKSRIYVHGNKKY